MNKKTTRWFWVLLSIILIAAVGYWAYIQGYFQQNQGKVYIAVVAPITGDYELDGQDMLNGVRLYVDKVNREGGINGIPVELIELDDQNNASLATEKASEIVAADRALVVIGHAFSSSSNNAGPIYEAAGIPAITGSATADSVTKDRDWYFRVIPSSRSQAVFIANYFWYILGYQTATVIYDTDAAGTSLAEPFQETFASLGGQVNYAMGVDRTRDDVDAQLAEIITTLKNKPDGEVGAIFFATKVPEGIELVVGLKNSNLDEPMFGSSAFSNIDFIEGFKQYPEELAISGYYSDDFHAISPVIFDVAGKVGQNFRLDFIEEFGAEPGMKAASNYDAVLIAVEAMKKARISGLPETRAADRQKIRDYMAGIDSPAKAVDGVTGSIQFDENGDIVKSNYIGVYKEHALISALTQLQPIANIKYVTDLDDALAKGDVFEIDGQYMYKTDVVYTGIDFIEVSNLNEKNSTYSMDFYLWFRYKDDVDASNIEFINMAKGVSLGNPIKQDVINGENYAAYRVKSDFFGDFLFHAYPFDHQDMAIKFKHASLTRERLIYVIDFRGMELTKGTNALQKMLAADTPILNIGSWKPEQVNFFQDIMTTQSTLGNPNFFGADSDIEYSRFNALIDIKRDTLSFGLKNLLPLIAVTILAYLSVFLPVSQFAIKNAIGRGALMTVAFFHIKLSNDLPGIGYTVALDYVFYIMYILIVADLVLSVIIQSENSRERTVVVARLTRAWKVLFPGIIAAGILWFGTQFGIF